MNSKTESTQSTFDSVKLTLALVLVLGAIAAYYYFADASKLPRFLGLVGATVIAAVIASQTDKGRSLAGFVKESQIEVRRVVWPTRQETLQTTLVVMAVVLVVAVLLWLLDLMLGGLVRLLMGQGS